MTKFDFFVVSTLSNHAHFFRENPQYEKVVALIIDFANDEIQRKGFYSKTHGSFKNIIERRNARLYLKTTMDCAVSYIRSTEHLSENSIGAVHGPYDYLPRLPLLTAIEQESYMAWVAFVDQARLLCHSFDNIDDKGPDEIVVIRRESPPVYNNRSKICVPESSDESDGESSPQLIYAGF